MSSDWELPTLEQKSPEPLPQPAAKPPQKNGFRRNLVLSSILHSALIASVLLLSAFAPKNPEQPIWVDLGVGGTEGAMEGLGGDNGDGNKGDAAPPPMPDLPAPPAPQPPAPSAEVSAPPKPEPVKHEAPKPAIKEHDVIPTELPKKVEKKIEKTQPKKVETTNEVKKSTKVITRSKSTPASNANVVNPKNAGKNFNAKGFSNSLMAKIGGDGGTGGKGTRPGAPGPLGPGRGNHIGAGTGPGRGLHGDGSGDGKLPSQYGWYYLMIKAAMDQAWQQPGQLQGDISCVLYIRIQRDGTVSNAWFQRKSGDVVMDESVLTAVNSVRRIAPLPAGLAGPGGYADIPVAFELKPMPNKRG